MSRPEPRVEYRRLGPLGSKKHNISRLISRLRLPGRESRIPTGVRGAAGLVLGEGKGWDRQLLARGQGLGGRAPRPKIGQPRVANPTSMGGPTGQSRAVHLGHRHLVRDSRQALGRG
jgi:hypothetical protein